MNAVQKVFVPLLKALGFPVWTGSTADIPPGGWRALDWSGQSSQLLDIPVFRGIVRVLGQTIGSIPFNIFKENSEGVRVKATDHPAYPIIHDSPNSYMTSMELRQSMMLDWCMGGNGYAEIIKSGRRLLAFNPLPAERMAPQFVQGKFIYRFTTEDGNQQDLPPENVIHIKNPGSRGYVGMPHVPRALLQRAIDTHSYGANFMRNQGRPSGVLSSDQSPPANEESSKKMRAQWDEAFSGPANAGKTAVLWKNLKYQAISVNPDDAQYNETCRQLDAEFAGIYGVPLNLLDQTDKTATYASAEQFSLQFVKYVIGPISEMFEQAFNKKLFLASEPGVFCELDLDALLRGDSQAQATYFSTLANSGVVTRDEARRKLNFPELGNGADKLTVQTAMGFLDDLGKQQQLPPQAPLKQEAVGETK